jgi:WD40 repeat protein
VFAPDGGRILTASADKTARLWGRDGNSLATLQGHTSAVFTAVFAPDGDRILTASADNTARLWDRDGKSLATLQGHTNTVISAVFAPDRDRILTASWDNTARLWDRDGKPLATLHGHTREVRDSASVCCLADGWRPLSRRRGHKINPNCIARDHSVPSCTGFLYVERPREPRDGGTFTGRLMPPKTISWSNNTAWTKT